MRVFVDTNIYISYLLTPKVDSFVDLLLDHILSQQLTLLVAEPLLDEIVKTVQRKPYLLNKITETRLQRFMALLKSIAEDVPLISAEIPPITRDPKDDFLIAYAVLGRADFLVSGDQDLLVLEQVGNIKIVTPGDFRLHLKS